MEKKMYLVIWNNFLKKMCLCFGTFYFKMWLYFRGKRLGIQWLWWQVTV